jgi:hypothetical protein
MFASHGSCPGMNDTEWEYMQPSVVGYTPMKLGVKRVA